MYAGDVGRANGWTTKSNQSQVNTLRHALSAAYITYRYGADSAMLGGDWHELETSVRETGQKFHGAPNPKTSALGRIIV